MVLQQVLSRRITHLHASLLPKIDSLIAILRLPSAQRRYQRAPSSSTSSKNNEQREAKLLRRGGIGPQKACTITGGGSNTSTATTTTCYSTLDDGSEIINTEVEAQQKATEGLLLKNPACACQRFVESIGKCDFYTRVCSRFRKAAPSFIGYFGIACLGGEVENSIRANCASSSFPYDPLTAKDEAVSSLYRRKHSLC